MSTMWYPAIIERAGASFSVFFPDLPGCTSAGKSLQDAALNAEEALGGHLLELARGYKAAIPLPRRLDDLERRP